MTADILQSMASAFMATAEAQGRRSQEAFATSDITTYQAQRGNAQLFHDLAASFSVAAELARRPQHPFPSPPSLEGFVRSDEPVQAFASPEDMAEAAEQVAQEISEVVPIIKAPKVRKATESDAPRPPAHTRVAIDGGPIQGDDDGSGGVGAG